jgi:hypothetical protein
MQKSYEYGIWRIFWLQFLLAGICFLGVRWTKIKKTEERGNEKMEKAAGGSASNGGSAVMRAKLWT